MEDVHMSDLKTIRLDKELTQKEAAERLGISLRSYVTYENDESRSGTSKYRFFLHELSALNQVDEEHGILSVEEITKKCADIFKDYNVHYCYLFGSYAKGNAGESSDVDLLISSDEKGLKFCEMVERLREVLHKKVDALDHKQLLKNEVLLNEVLKDGIKIYG